ncbi:MAG TPA: NADH-quinone oxidoreductase subunit NuoE [Sedimentisphaerales bacterium]|nr:NADH-quinone oxidoreductase subunit NuoE [Sedimentisphaerales bacterium]
MAKTLTKERATPATHEEKLAELKAHMAELQKQENPHSQLISILHKAQGLYGYLPNHVMDEIALTMGIPTAHIWGVATFYHYFKLTPPGRYEIALCLGTACYVKGAAQILQVIKDELKIDVGGVTEDGVFSLAPARCLGACGLAPVAMIGEKIHGELTPRKIVQIIKDYRKQAEKDK